MSASVNVVEFVFVRSLTYAASSLGFIPLSYHYSVTCTKAEYLPAPLITNPTRTALSARNGSSHTREEDVISAWIDGLNDTLALGDNDADGDADDEGDPEADADGESDADADGLLEADGEIEGLSELDGDVDADGLPDADGEIEADDDLLTDVLKTTLATLVSD